MEIITIKMDKGLLQRVDSALKQHNYSTRTEFIRDSIRGKLTNLEKEEAILGLAALRGSLKGKAKMSDRAAGELALKNLMKQHGWSLNELK